jgi:hypothetical protein
MPFSHPQLADLELFFRAQIRRLQQENQEAAPPSTKKAVNVGVAWANAVGRRKPSMEEQEAQMY